MIAINNQPVADMMKVIDSNFIEKHNSNIRIEPTMHSIFIKYIREFEVTIKDVYFIFNGDGCVIINGLDLTGKMIHNQAINLNRRGIKKAFQEIIKESFGINAE